MQNVTPTQFKKLGLVKPTEPEAKKWEHLPMFLPTKSANKAVVTVTTRQKFLDENIKLWRNWHFYRLLAIVLALVAVLWLRISIYLTIAGAIAAAWAYGEHIKANFTINMILKRRDLLWTK